MKTPREWLKTFECMLEQSQRAGNERMSKTWESVIRHQREVVRLADAREGVSAQVGS